MAAAVGKGAGKWVRICTGSGSDPYLSVIVFHAQTHQRPSPPPLMCTHQASASEADKLIGTAARPFSPFEVVGDVNGDGLGLLSWWSPAAEEE